MNLTDHLYRHFKYTTFREQQKEIIYDILSGYDMLVLMPTGGGKSICFQLPVLLTLMGKAGLVSAEGLGNVRKYAVVAILVLAALVTPPDVITQVILFVVVYGLYEVSIFLVSRVEKKREQKLRAEGFYDDEDDFDDPILKEFDEDRKE